MRFMFAVMAVAITASCFGQTNEKSNDGHGTDEQSIIQIEQEMLASLLKGDASAYERYLADTCRLTDPDGMVMDKARLLSDIKSGDLKFESSKLDDMRVQVYGDTAVATYGSTDKGSYKGKEISGRFRWTDVFVKRGGRWQTVAGQGTRLAQQ
ncbi:MAG: nuclear transport factor 2 family protein [Bryobacteraceae bacterium]